MAGHILMTIAVLLTVAPRCVALVEVQAKFYRADAWGFAADVVVGLWVGLVIVALHRWKRWAAAVAVGAWTVLGFLAAEHVRALGAWPDARQMGMLGDSTFVIGSLLRPAHPGWMLLAVSLGAGGVWWVKKVRYREAARRGLLAAAAGTLVLLVAPSNPADGWRGTHYVAENLGRLWRDRAGGDGLAAAQEIAVGESHRRRVDAWFRTDLGGVRLTAPPDPQRRPNVLLVVVESLGSDRIGPIHGLPYDLNEAPHLSALAQRSLFVPRFVNQQRQTNRGTYALLSGALPLLQKSTPRMSVFASLPERPYLPGVLTQHGYRTAYLQSADLAFMAKGPFLKAAGFQEVLSAVGVRPARASSAWGVDDVTLMGETLRWIDAADSKEASNLNAYQPWFLTVVTAGTHHPYMIPDDFAALPGETEDQRAFRYADAAIGHLVAGLDGRNTLNDTLVIVTSDETSATQDQSRVPPEISEAWGVFIASLPNRSRSGAIDGLYGQGDVALSVLDYLGLAESSPPFFGRSVFREYETPRELPFANVYRRQIGVFLEDGGVELYGEHFNPIAKFHPKPASGGQGFAGLTRDESAADLDYLGRPVLADLALRQSGRAGDDEPRPLTFIPPGRYTVTPSPDPRRGGSLTKGQYFYGPSDSQVCVEVSLTAESGAAVERIELRYLDFKVPVELDKNGRYYARRTVSLQRSRSAFDVELVVFTEDQRPMTINVAQAEITIKPIK